MIKSFQPSVGEVIMDKRETLKYHYTSPNAFLSILNGRKVHFTDARYLNDKTEDEIVIELIKICLEKNMGKYPRVYKAFGSIYDKKVEGNGSFINNSDYRGMRKFVFCTSTEPDSLVMWNYYVNNGNYQGYNLGFNIEKFLKTFDTEKSDIVDPFFVLYGGVIYREKNQFEVIESEIRKIELLRDKDDEYIMIQLIQFIDRYGLFFKHSKFEHEKEYRIVIEIDERCLNKNGFKNCFGENNKKIEYEFTTKHGLVVPYLNVTFNDDALSRITVSPLTEFAIAKKSVREVFRVNGYENVKVYKSNIPIRF